ncbi:MAG: cache domain-containing protein, partial [Candidatus Liptonbacteria bacterium]|nr:cache domain-containing protein [Candidatus Liptonbacteria bacterium]
MLGINLDNNQFLASKTGRRGLISFGLILILPIILIILFGFFRINGELPEYSEQYMRSFAQLGSITLTNKIRALVDLGDIFAQKPQFRELVAGGQWENAISVANSLTGTKLNDFINRILLLAPDGTLMAGSPSFEGENLIGTSFASRDYYKGVSREWKPYVSEIFQRASYPQYNVTTIAIPIFEPTGDDSAEHVAGILGLSVVVDQFLARMGKIEIGNGVTMYVVDQRGRIAMHPTQPAMADFSSVPVVQSVLKGEF